ncbi:MAG: carboxypeptidase-like regulatory domain-containing protein, partial [Capnocytophaga sp.]
MLALLLCLGGSYAQTRVSGQVVDEQGEPVPFASVIFKNTKVGTACDENGKFSLYTPKNYNTLEVSSVGFTSREIILKKRESLSLKIILTEGEMLEEVVIVQKPTKNLSKKENPAYPILQKIWAHKYKNSLTTSKAYEYKRYESVEMGLNNLDTVFLKKSMKKEYGNIKDLLSSREANDHYSLPMFLREEVSKVYGDNTRSLTRTDIEAERTQGVMQTGFGMERFTRNFRDFDVYDNSFYFLD